MMVVNGFNPGAVFFRDMVTVTPNTNYLFTAWILNLFKVTGYPDPELGVRILDQNNNILYEATLGVLIPPNTNAPEWKQIGSVINSRNNTSLTVEFISEGPEVIGNDYAIDDISLNEIAVPEFIPVKTASTAVAGVGETVEYTVTLTNTCQSPLTNVFFQDTLPDGLSFVPGSVMVNNVPDPSVNPNTGFILPDVNGGETVTVSFEAEANFIPTPNPTLNSADITYSYTPVEGGIPVISTQTSNEVPVEIIAAEADMAVTKTASPNPVAPGQMLTYTITVTNLGPNNADNVVLTDAVPASFLNPEFSTNGVNFQPWPGFLALGAFAPDSAQTILIRGTVSPAATGSLVNTALVSSTTPDPNPDNNTSTIVTFIRGPREQAITDLIESVALEEAGLAHILNAEGEKL